MHQFLKFIFGIQFYLFRAVPMSIIRSFSLCSQQWYMSYSLPVWHIPLLCVQRKTPDDGQRNCPKYVDFYYKNKFEKLLHLVGSIIRIYHDARSPERELGSSVCRECRGARPCDNGMNMQDERKARTFFEPEQLVTYPDRFFSTKWSDPICHSGQRIPSLSAHFNPLLSDCHSSASRFPALIRAKNRNPTTVNTKCLF